MESCGIHAFTSIFTSKHIINYISPAKAGHDDCLHTRRLHNEAELFTSEGLHRCMKYEITTPLNQAWCSASQRQDMAYRHWDIVYEAQALQSKISLPKLDRYLYDAFVHGCVY